MRTTCTLSCLICLVALFGVATEPALSQASANVDNAPVQMGMKTLKSLSNLSVFDSKAVYDIEDYSNTKPTYDVSSFSNTKPIFDASQRSGQRSHFNYTTATSRFNYTFSAKPLYDISQAAEVKPLYDISDRTRTKAVHTIGGSKVVAMNWLGQY